MVCTSWGSEMNNGFAMSISNIKFSQNKASKFCKIWLIKFSWNNIVGRNYLIFHISILAALISNTKKIKNCFLAIKPPSVLSKLIWLFNFIFLDFSLLYLLIVTQIKILLFYIFNLILYITSLCNIAKMNVNMPKWIFTNNNVTPQIILFGVLLKDTYWYTFEPNSINHAYGADGGRFYSKFKSINGRIHITDTIS